MKTAKWISLVASFALIFSLFAMILTTDETYAASNPYYIEINKKTNWLYLYKNGKLYKKYRVATGKTKNLTPEGTFPVYFKTTYPGWKGIPGGDPRNPLGPRWIGLRVNGDKGRTYGIHGTNAPSSIGKHASSGCVRMYNSDVIELYKLVPIGTKVRIHSGTSSSSSSSGAQYETFKSASGKIMIIVKRANIRSKPTVNKPVVIAKANRGTKFKLIALTPTWFKIQLSNGKIAYVHRSVAKRI